MISLLLPMLILTKSTLITNADTNEEYLDGDTLIPKNTFLIVRRSPRCICMPIVINPPVAPEDDTLVLKEYNPFDEPSTSLYPKESEWVEFWNDLSPPKVVVPVQDASPSEDDKDRKIRDISAMYQQKCHNHAASYGAGRGFGRGAIAVRSEGSGFGQGGLPARITPQPGYICHRCKVPGHFIQHCPTNGDPDFDIKKTKPPTGIPSSMLIASPDGSYALPSGGIAVLKPNEAAFQKEIQRIPSTRSVVVLPPELYCPICKAVMKDAVFASKCCFKSFCDKCIRDYIMSKSLCTCGAKKVLADDLLPNKTLRGTIVRFLESTSGSGAKGGSTESPPCPQSKLPCSKVPSPALSAPSKRVVLEGNTKVEDMTKPVEVDNVAKETSGKVTVREGVEVSEASHECARESGSQICLPAPDEDMQSKIPCTKVPSSYLSAPSKGIVVATISEETTKLEEMIDSVEADNVRQKTLGKVTVGNGVEVSEAAHGCAMEPGSSQMCPAVTDKELPQKPISGEVEKKRKESTDMQPRPRQEFADMLLESSGCNPYWNCMQPYCGQMPFMGYGLGPMSIPFGGPIHHNTLGAQMCMMPIPPQRDLAKFGTGSDGEFHLRNATIKQKRDHEKSGGSMEVSRDRDFSRDMISHKDIPSMKSKFKSISPPDHNHPRPQLERPHECCTHDSELIRIPSKRKVKHDDDYPEDLPSLPSKSSSEKKVSDWKHRASVYARITFSEGKSGVYKKRKLGDSFAVVNGSSTHRSQSMTSNQYHKDQCNTAAAAVSKNIYKYAENHDYESNDDDMHFKRRPSRYETLPASVGVQGRHSSSRWREKRVIPASISRLSVF